MSPIIDGPRVSSPEVILTCIADEPTRLAIFSSEDDFLSVIERMPEQEQEVLWNNRQLGRKALEDDGHEVVGAGTERIVLGLIDEVGELVVHKYAVQSRNPQVDILTEIKDYNFCREQLGDFVVETEFEVVKIGDKEVLRETQPWLDIVPAQTVERPNPRLDAQIDDIYEVAQTFPNIYGRYLDGTTLMADVDSNVVIIDTSLVLPPEEYVVRLSATPDLVKTESSRPERTWRSLGMVAA